MIASCGGAFADFVGLAPAEPPGRQRAATPLRLFRHLEVHAAQHVVQHPVADRPLFQRADLDRHRVLDRVDVPRQRAVEVAEEPFDRVFEKVEQVGEYHVIGRRRG